MAGDFLYSSYCQQILSEIKPITIGLIGKNEYDTSGFGNIDNVLLWLLYLRLREDCQGENLLFELTVMLSFIIIN